MACCFRRLLGLRKKVRLQSDCVSPHPLLVICGLSYYDSYTASIKLSQFESQPCCSASSSGCSRHRSQLNPSIYIYLCPRDWTREFEAAQVGRPISALRCEWIHGRQVTIEIQQRLYNLSCALASCSARTVIKNSNHCAP